MKALCVVAHPDDCVIFAWPFIDTFTDFEWTILYLTYDTNSNRGKEVSEFWKKRNVHTNFLGYVDTYLDIENNQISFNTANAQKDLILTSLKYDLILTHNAQGEYGHIHHKFVHDSLQIVNKPKVYFADDKNFNLVCKRSSNFDIDELPLHKDVIIGFTDIQTGRYTVDDVAKEVLYVKIQT